MACCWQVRWNYESRKGQWMSKLDNLQKDVSSMTTEELLVLVRDIRKDRTVPKRAAKAAAKTAKKTGVKKKASVKSIIASMTPEEKKALLQKLKG